MSETKFFFFFAALQLLGFFSGFWFFGCGDDEGEKLVSLFRISIATQYSDDESSARGLKVFLFFP